MGHLLCPPAGTYAGGVFSDMASDMFSYLAYFLGMLQGNRTF